MSFTNIAKLELRRRYREASVKVETLQSIEGKFARLASAFMDSIAETRRDANTEQRAIEILLNPNIEAEGGYVDAQYSEMGDIGASAQDTVDAVGGEGLSPGLSPLHYRDIDDRRFAQGPLPPTTPYPATQTRTR